ncbi:MAG: 4Fe-4S dicluster domain-containing protein [Candidatus Korobacteraceae bacterium]|jgi:Fe-S-cluster-containing dehydrogenase component
MKIKINEDICTGCRSCELACSAAHSGDFSPERSRIRITNKAIVGESSISTCSRCDDPKCVAACTYEACIMNAATKVIRIDYELCNGCYACVDACEFHAAFVDPIEHVPLICDFCGGDPMCVKFCYKQAIQPDNSSLPGTENAADLG